MLYSKPPFLFDTGPLSVLCGFPIKDEPYIHQVLQYVTILIPDGVAGEAGVGKVSRVIRPLMNAGQVINVKTPENPAILDTAYGTLLGGGERSVIKTALAERLTPILDDRDAFVVACRFGVQPIGFQDFIVSLVKSYEMPKELGVEIVTATARQFQTAFLTHTLVLLET